MQRCSERASEQERERARARKREREREREREKRERGRKREREREEPTCHQDYLRERVCMPSALCTAHVLIHEYSYLRDNTIRHDIIRVSGSKLGTKEASNV